MLGAVRAGIHEIILPMDNEADLEDIPEAVRKGMTFHLAETLDDVMQVALTDGKRRAKPSVNHLGATDEAGDGKKPNGQKPAAKKKASGSRKSAAKKKPTKK